MLLTHQLPNLSLYGINDFPAYANLSRWSTKGRVACLVCAEKTESRWLREDILREVKGVNFIYGKARKSDREELDEGSVRLDVDEGCDLFNNFKELLVEGDESNLINQDETLSKKMSIFFDLPYWHYNLLRHNLDVMHIKKNICDNVVGTLLNLSRGGKDNFKARKDLQDMGI
ncbi:hypothetical protein PVK06_024211 [Gossypium arboreum]|uniref:Uncharacterized protein n=1 Tax=Gossypium arboreum TaxID=29729 RepID=A0ABR0PDE5_GOSAR|nr:hypothetical protein PVK06_024211 [Gossypium arboreum]